MRLHLLLGRHRRGLLHRLVVGCAHLRQLQLLFGPNCNNWFGLQAWITGRGADVGGGGNHDPTRLVGFQGHRGKCARLPEIAVARFADRGGQNVDDNTVATVAAG